MGFSCNIITGDLGRSPVFLVGTWSGAVVEVADFAGWGVDHAGIHDELRTGSAEFLPLRIERVAGAGHWFPGRRECCRDHGVVLRRRRRVLGVGEDDRGGQQCDCHEGDESAHVNLRDEKKDGE